jgi:hypothetical protein
MALDSYSSRCGIEQADEAQNEASRVNEWRLRKHHSFFQWLQRGRTQNGCYPEESRVMMLVCLARLALALAASSRMGVVSVPNETQAGAVTLLGSVTLQENESAFIGRVQGLAVSKRGNIYVSDDLNFVVREFSPSGKRLRVFGRKGRGPGEFTSPGVLGLDGDSVLLVDGGRMLAAFDLRSGKLQWEKLKPARMLMQLTPRGGNVYMNAVFPTDTSKRVSVAWLRPADDRVEFARLLPAPLNVNVRIAATFSYMQFVLYSSDSLAAVFSATPDYLYVGRLAKPEYDSIPIARAVRRGGLSKAVIRKILDDPGSLVMADLLQPTVPKALTRLSSGHFAYLGSDPAVVSGRLTGPLYLTLVDVRRGVTCPDSKVPVGEDPVPWSTFLGDTLFVISQEETPDKQPVTVVRRFRVDAAYCRWVKP